MNNLGNSRSYRTFINDRDNALERILRNTQLRNTELMNMTFVSLIDLVSARYPTILMQPHFSKHKVRDLDRDIDHLFHSLAQRIYVELQKMRKKTFILTYAAEHRAIQDQAKTDKPVTKNAHHLLDVSRAKLSDMDMYKKIDHALTGIKRKVIAAVELSLLMEEPIEKMQGRVLLALPKKKQFPQKKILKRVKAIESDAGGKVTAKIGLTGKQMGGIIDQAAWTELVDDYMNDYIPNDRSPANVFDIQNPWSDEKIREDIPSEEAIYGWDIERDTTHDFVQQVRNGQIDAAKENGVDEFIIIAIIDEKTCDACCGDFGCSDFDGKLSSEVEAMTKGEQSVPPYHFNCRCTVAPASTQMERVDETESKREFEEWLLT